jgi:hypothetical protein
MHGRRDSIGLSAGGATFHPATKIAWQTHDVLRWSATIIGASAHEAVTIAAGLIGRQTRLQARRENGMSKTGLDNRHRNHDGEISQKHGNTKLSTLRKIYGMYFAAGYPETQTLSEVLLQLNETSLSQLRRDYETGHLAHKITKASK